VGHFLYCIVHKQGWAILCSALCAIVKEMSDIKYWQTLHSNFPLHIGYGYRFHSVCTYACTAVMCAVCNLCCDLLRATAVMCAVCNLCCDLLWATAVMCVVCNLCCDLLRATAVMCAVCNLCCDLQWATAVMCAVCNLCCD
jgi:hypothetical protein